METAKEAYRISCTTEGCRYEAVTKANPTFLWERLHQKGCPCCGRTGFQRNWNPEDLTASHGRPILSVIIPFYKVENYIRQCIESVLSQTLQETDVILVEDGSPDDCGKICEEYLDDLRVTVIHKKNGGLSLARNTGLDLVRSEYVTFVDGDDYLCNPQAYENIYAVLKKTNADMAYFNYVPFPDGEEPKLPDSLHSDRYTVMEREEAIRFFFSKALTMYAAVQWNKMFRSSLFEKATHDAGAYCQDLRIMPDIERQLQRAVIAEECAVCYRMERSGAITHEIKPKLLFDRTLSVRKVLDYAVEFGEESYIKNLTPALADYCMSAYYSTWRGISKESEQAKATYLRELQKVLSEEKNLLFSKRYHPDFKHRLGIKIFCLNRYAFCVYNRIFNAFHL